MRLIFTLFAVFSIPAFAYAQKGESLPTKKAVFDSWGNLDKHLKSLVMTIRCKEHHTGHVSDGVKRMIEGTRNAKAQQGGPPYANPHGEYPPVSVESNYTLTWTPSKLRLDRTGFDFGLDDRNVVKNDYSFVTNGKVVTKFSDIGILDYPWASINSGDRVLQLEYALTAPNCHLLFGVNSNYSSGFPTAPFEFEWLKGNGEGPKLRGTASEKHDPKRVTEWSYTFLPRRRFAVSEFDMRSSTGMRIQYKAEFDPNGPISFIPKSWGIEYYDGEKLTHSRNYSVVSIQRDATLPENAFTIDFPPGTQVRDMTVKPAKTYTVPAKP